MTTLALARFGEDDPHVIMTGHIPLFVLLNWRVTVDLYLKMVAKSIVYMNVNVFVVEMCNLLLTL